MLYGLKKHGVGPFKKEFDESANLSSVKSNESIEQKLENESIEQKLDKLYNVMNDLRWIGFGIGGMFAITFIIPQFCTGG